MVALYNLVQVKCQNVLTLALRSRFTACRKTNWFAYTFCFVYHIQRPIQGRSSNCIQPFAKEANEILTVMSHLKCDVNDDLCSRFLFVNFKFLSTSLMLVHALNKRVTQ